MNKIHRLLFNRATGQWVVAAETAKSRGKGGSKSAMCKETVVMVFTALGLGIASAACMTDTIDGAKVNDGTICNPSLGSYLGGLNASGTGSVLNIAVGTQIAGGSNPFDTLGVRQQTGVLVTNGATVNIADGVSITTTTPNAHGIFWSTGQDINLNTVANVAVSGKDSRGIVLSSAGNINLQSGGAIKATNASSSVDFREGIGIGASVGQNNDGKVHNITINVTGSVETVAAAGSAIGVRNWDAAALGVIDINTVEASSIIGGIVAAGGAIKIATANVKGDIVAYSNRGDVEIDTTQGTQTGRIRVNATNGLGDTTGHQIKIKTADVNSPRYGVDVQIYSNAVGSAGVSTVDIDTTQGTVTAKDFGIVTNSQANTGNVTIKVGEMNVQKDGLVNGFGAAIAIQNRGVGTTTVTTTAGTTINSQFDGINVWEAKNNVTVNNFGSIISAEGNGINLSDRTILLGTRGAIGGSTINNSGNITATSAGKFAILGGVAIDTVNQSAGSINGNTSLGGGNDEFSGTGGAVNGSIFGDAGDDRVNLSGALDLSGTVRIDGGVGTDTLNIADLNVRGFTGADNVVVGTNIVGIETINVTKAGTLKLTGDLFAAGGSGALNIASGSNLDLKGASPGVFTINGSVANSGTMTMQDGAGDDVTTITGNYDGTAAQWKIDTVFGGDSSATDRLVVNGNVTGKTTVNISKVGGTGAQTTNGILLAKVDGTAAAGSFVWDIGNLQVGNYQYVLQQGSAIDPNDFYLVSAVQDLCKVNPASCVPVTPTPTPTPEPGQEPVVYSPPDPMPVVYVPEGPKPVPLWRPAISGYSVARSMNADIGFMQSATLHQRMGDLTVQSIDQGKSWARVLAQDVSGMGKNRFDYDQSAQGIQVGRDVANSLNDQKQQTRMGVMLHHVKSNTDAWDQVRPAAGLTHDTAKIKTSATGLGGYHTTIDADGQYNDLVVQVNTLSNDFVDSYGDKARQKGLQIGASVEHGRPYPLNDNWVLEAQGQLSALVTRYQAFEDKFSNIDAQDFNTVRGRIGARIHNSGQSKTETRYYGIVNLNHDLVKTKKMTLQAKDASQTTEVGETFDQTYAEVGVGAQAQLSEGTWGFVDARYEHGIKGRKNTWKLNVGVRF
jgi:autotransporter family porin